MTSQVQTIRDALASIIAQADALASIVAQANALESLSRIWCKPNDYAGVAMDAEARDGVAIDRALRRLTDKTKNQFEEIQQLKKQLAEAVDYGNSADVRIDKLERALVVGTTVDPRIVRALKAMRKRWDTTPALYTNADGVEFSAAMEALEADHG